MINIIVSGIVLIAAAYSIGMCIGWLYHKVVVQPRWKDYSFDLMNLPEVSEEADSKWSYNRKLTELGSLGKYLYTLKSGDAVVRRNLTYKSLEDLKENFIKDIQIIDKSFFANMPRKQLLLGKQKLSYRQKRKLVHTLLKTLNQLEDE